MEIRAREAFLAAVRRECAALKSWHQEITSCRGDFETLGSGMNRQYSVSLDVRAPQHQTIVCGRPRPSLEAALGAAFDAAGKSLRERAATAEECADAPS